MRKTFKTKIALLPINSITRQPCQVECWNQCSGVGSKVIVFVHRLVPAGIAVQVALCKKRFLFCFVCLMDISEQEWALNQIQVSGFKIEHAITKAVSSSFDVLELLLTFVDCRRICIITSLPLWTFLAFSSTD